MATDCFLRTTSGDDGGRRLGTTPEEPKRSRAKTGRVLKALITEGEGFAGSHLAEHLLSQGQEVVAVVFDEAYVANLRHLGCRVRIVQADIRDFDRLVQVVHDTNPQRIYHLAAMSWPADSFEGPKLKYDVNFGGTLNLLCAWRPLELDCRLLFVGSADVYGPAGGDDTPLREDAPLRPGSPYVGSKLAAEILTSQFFESYGLPVVRVRPFNHTGPRQSESFVCSGFAKQIVEYEAGFRPNGIKVGNLDVCRDFSDVRDIVRGYCLLLEKGTPGEVYHLCSGRAVSVADVLQILTRLSSKPVPVSVDASKVRAHEAHVRRGDPSKAREATGWIPEYELETTLHDLKLYWEDVVQSDPSGMPRMPS